VKRIFERLRIEHVYAGGYTVVKDYVRIARSRSREVFVPPIAELKKFMIFAPRDFIAEFTRSRECPALGQSGKEATRTKHVR
jgi:hypothetical protein